MAPPQPPWPGLPSVPVAALSVNVELIQPMGNEGLEKFLDKRGPGLHHIAVEVFLKDVNPDTIRIELYADGEKGGGAVETEMKGTPQQGNGSGCYVYCATVSSARPATDYTARMMPRGEGLAVPLEAGWIRWQR